MQTTAFRNLSIGMLLLIPACATVAQNPRPALAPIAFSAEELDNLVAPIALYPDALLAQILIAATYPDQVALAARHVRERGTRGVDDEAWDLSVKAVSHYPPVLNMLAEDDDWSAALGQAYAAQSTDVMDAVQRLREMAREQGNLVSTEEQTVTVEGQQIVIVPANPQYIYVPTYDPSAVFFRPVFQFGFRTSFWSFGIGFPIGDWLSYDVDWYGRRIYYDGWLGGGWRIRSRPYIRLTPIYVHPRYRAVRVGNVHSRIVNFINVDRSHRRVHNTVSFVRHDRDPRRPVDRGRGSQWNNDTRGGRVGGVRNEPGNRDRPDNRGGRSGGDVNQGNRAPTFDTIRPERPGTSTKAGTEPQRSSPGFGVLDKRREAPAVRAPTNGGGNTRAPTAAPKKATPRPTVTFKTPPRPTQVRQPPASATTSTPRPTTRVQTSRPAVSAARSAPRPTTKVQTSRPPVSATRSAARPTVRVQASKPAKASSPRVAPQRTSGSRTPAKARSGGGRPN